MTIKNATKWLLLIHQIPPKSNALRVKIWRRLQRIGAVAIKQSVYAMPFTEQSREDLNWTLKEIVDGGGDGSISETKFLEGLTNEQVVAMFKNARSQDYEKLITEMTDLFVEWSSIEKEPVTVEKRPVHLSKFQSRFEEIASIDFFQSPQRGTAEILLRKLVNFISGHEPRRNETRTGYENLKDKIWVTRNNLYIDRLACGWLIRRFLDKEAAFKFVADPEYPPKADEIRFDMFEGEYTHIGDKCTFEVMVEHLRLQDHALVSMAEVVHDIDLKDQKFGRAEATGLSALLTGLVAVCPDDDHRMIEGFRIFETLYAFFHGQKRK